MDILIITAKELGNRPIICASLREKAIQDLFDYMGYVGKDNEKVIYHGFKEYEYNEEENDRSCIGEFTFEAFFAQKWESEKYHLYELTLDQKQK